MATRIESLLRARNYLDNPYPSAPDLSMLLQAELSEEANILNATNNTGKPWAVNVYQLNYNPGLGKYPVNATDFGKPYLVTRVVPGPYITRINVPFTDMNQQRYGAIWPWYAYGGPWSVESTTEQMSFFREGVTDSQYYVTIEPQPQQNATYEITYIPGLVGDDDPLEVSIQLPEHAALVQLRVAMACLAYAKWYEDENENRIKRKEIAASLDYQLHGRDGRGGKEALFKEYVSSIAIPRTVEIENGFDDYGYGI